MTWRLTASRPAPPAVNHSSTVQQYGPGARIVAEYLREAGWQEHAIGSATAQAGAIGYLRETG
jgi:hypothetical protein